MGPIFLTGGTGFVGRRLLQQAPSALRTRFRCLVRSPERLPAVDAGPPGWEAVPGTLGDPAAWRGRLQGCDTVLHLAAAAGKARAATFQAVNVDGTRALLQAAVGAGVRRFIFVSSVAAGFADQRFYPYAWSKLAGEHLVSEAGLAGLIVRPTMILGPGSAVLRGLAALAGAPIGVCVGSGRLPVQPVHVDDVAEFLLAALELEAFPAAPIGLGGPATLSLEALLRQIRVALRGKPGPLLHLPLAPVRRLLALAEPLLLPVMPLTAGQLASFANPGTVPADPWPVSVARPQRDLSAMLNGLR